jgi:hypothetical protein
MTLIIPTTITLEGAPAIVTHIFGINSNPNLGCFVPLFSGTFGAKGSGNGVEQDGCTCTCWQLTQIQIFVMVTYVFKNL